MQVVDIAEIAEIAHEYGALCTVDNTFATPYLQRPLELGADIVAHSLTKYLGGHSDVVGGALVTDDEGLDEQLGFYQNSVGATPDPFACFLVLRGTKTLPIRMDRHSGNARDLAAWLDDHQSLTLLIWLGRTIRHLMPSTLWIEVPTRLVRNGRGTNCSKYWSKTERLSSKMSSPGQLPTMF
jgi:cystathionine gamma-lyase